MQGAPGHDRAYGKALSGLLTRRLARTAAVVSVVGGVIVYVFLAFLFPIRASTDDFELLVKVNAIVAALFTAIALPLGGLWNIRRSRRVNKWLESGEPPSREVRGLALRLPFDFALSHAVAWGIAAIVFAAINWAVLPAVGPSVLITIALAGLTVAALGYLVAERVVRPVWAMALAGDPPARPVGPGVAARITTAWTLATGVPLVGVVAVTLVYLLADDTSAKQAVGGSLFLAGVALLVGLFAIVVAARSVADPIAGVRDGLQRVEAGDFGVRVPVDDGSEIGLLEAGFNRMAAGLDEREQMRDLFGRHVGEDVARAALDGDVALGGEEREIAALFVDLVGSTRLASRRPPSEVVALLNRFFEIVVQVAEAHGGLVNKFEGDAALCVFGAPVSREDPAGDALAAARALQKRLDRELPEVDVGIGVSAGTAVAGNVGAEHRFEYTVIGDPVNEAARLCDLAKQRNETVLASGDAVNRANGTETGSWTLGERVTLRGRDQETRLATLAG